MQIDAKRLTKDCARAQTALAANGNAPCRTGATAIIEPVLPLIRDLRRQKHGWAAIAGRVRPTRRRAGHPSGGAAIADRSQPSCRVRRGRLRRHIRKRSSRIAHRLFVSARQPKRCACRRHRGSLNLRSAGARTVWATRCRTIMSTRQ